MTLKVATATAMVVKERKVYEDPISIMLRAIVRNTVNVWAKIIEQELSLSVCLKPVCLHHR